MYFITLDMTSLPFPFPFQISLSRNLHNIRFDSVDFWIAYSSYTCWRNRVSLSECSAHWCENCRKCSSYTHAHTHTHAWEAVVAFWLLEQVYALCAQLGSNCCSIATRDDGWMMELCWKSKEMCQCCRNYTIPLNVLPWNVISVFCAAPRAVTADLILRDSAGVSGACFTEAEIFEVVKWVAKWAAVRLLGYLPGIRLDATSPARRHYHRRQRQVLALPEVATASASASASRHHRVGVVGISEFSTLSALFIIIANFHIIMRGRIRRQAGLPPSYLLPPASSSSLVSSCYCGSWLPSRRVGNFRSVQLSWVIYLSSAQTINIKVNYSLCLCENPYVINVCSEIFGCLFLQLLLQPALCLFYSLLVFALCLSHFAHSSGTLIFVVVAAVWISWII